MGKWTTGESLAVGVVGGIVLLVIADVVSKKYSPPKKSLQETSPTLPAALPAALPAILPNMFPPDALPPIPPVAYPIYIVKAGDPNGATLKNGPSAESADLTPKIANETIVSAVGVPSNGYVHVLDPADLNLVVGWIAIKDLQPLIPSGIPVPGTTQT